jgi:hypothetical protein
MMFLSEIMPWKKKINNFGSFKFHLDKLYELDLSTSDNQYNKICQMYQLLFHNFQV